MPEKRFERVDSFRKYLRENIKGWDNEKIYVSPRTGSSCFIVLTIDGKLKTICTSYGSSSTADFLIPRLIEYFETGIYDDSKKYYKIYSSNVLDEEIIYEVNSSLSSGFDILKEARLIDQSCGIKEVPKSAFFTIFNGNNLVSK